MRTLLDTLHRRPVGERRYEIEGSIVFEFAPSESRECSPEMKEHLESVIKHVDTIHPWKDQHDHDGSECASIWLLQFQTNQYHNIRSPELHVWFRIVPQFYQVRQHQVYAYERYLAGLAKELAKQVPEATSVRAVMETTTITAHFKT